MNPDQGNNDPGQGCNDSGPGSGRGHKPPARRRRRNLPRRVVRNRMLEGMPKSRTVDASSQEYRVPNFTNRQNIDLNQGMTEYAQGDVLQSVNFDDLGPLRRMLHDDEHFLLNSFPTGGRDKSNTQNFTPHQGNQQGCPVQSGWGQQRQVLPPIIINEGGGGRSRGRVVGRETNNRDKGIHVQLQPEPEDEYDEFSA